MKVELPIYVRKDPPRAGGCPLFSVRPLFHDQPVAGGELLAKALAKLTQRVVRHVRDLAREQRQDQLAGFLFRPQGQDREEELVLELKGQRVHARFLFVTFEQLGIRVAFTPGLRDLWFEIPRGTTLAERAREVLQHHFRDLERREIAFDLGELAIQGKAWTSLLDLELPVRPPELAEKASRRALLGAEAAVDGALELWRVGRCLDHRYPDDLQTAVLREAEREALRKALDDPRAGPVLLLGPRGCGKTVLVHDYVWSTVDRHKSPYQSKRNTWLLAPQRLISGMSYVGQWETRLQTILRHAQKERHLLYFDDLLGLFKAGVSAQSNLNVAQVLKRWLQRREVRVLAEATPETYRILQELDRGLADLFLVLRVPEASGADALRILLRVQRRLEARFKCRFGTETLPAILELMARYVRDAVLPGKAAAFLTQLALKYRDRDVGRAEVMETFQAHSGLSTAFLDERKTLRLAEVVEALQERVLAQPAAVTALARRVVVAKAQLNDPNRPLGCFLFLGPTGSGKTHAAKSLAAYLYGDSQKAVRFDLNEFADAGAAARLAGTFQQPEGLLTAAIRRQPFCVLLLDEIEKAHPLVFDLLLQVLGEGRLSDGLGRTADFGNAFVILTSNLGAEEAASVLGFGAALPRDAAPLYRRAAERFFRPEFFNRIDEVVPFQPLPAERMRDLAARIVREVLEREGLARRTALLDWHPLALERLAEAGFHPELGARALKRTVERELAQPVALKLGALTGRAPVAISILPQETLQTGAHLAVLVRELAWRKPVAPALPPDWEPAPWLKRIETAAARIGRLLDALAPQGNIAGHAVTPRQIHYFAMRERLRWVEDQLAKQKAWFAPRARRAAVRTAARRPRRRWTPVAEDDRKRYREIFAARDAAGWLDEWLARTAQSATASVRDRDALSAILGNLALLDLMARTMTNKESLAPAEVALLLRTMDQDSSRPQTWLAEAYEKLAPGLGLSIGAVERGSRRILLAAEGPHAAELLALEAGVHLFFDRARRARGVQVLVLPAPAGATAACEALAASRERWLEALARGEARAEDDPLAAGPIVRIYGEEEGATLDLGTGLAARGLPEPGELRRFLLAQLPGPVEGALT